MNIRLTPLAALICGVLFSTPLSAAQETAQRQLGLSDYRYFKVYPHLARAQRAIKENDEARAVASFQHAHEMAPESVQITLWLAEAYRHFGHDDKARALLDEQLRKTPDDKNLRLARGVIPVAEHKVETIAALYALQNACDANPSIHCRSEVGEHAIKLSQLNVAKAQLGDRAFRHSPQGRALIGELSQRAIFLQQWQTADQSFALLDEQQTLSEAQYQQWFAVLLLMQRDERILDLQRQGVMNTPAMQLTYARSLAERNAIRPLQGYMARRHPGFESASEEHDWLRLLATYSEDPGKAVANWQIKYPQNRQYLLATLLPVRMQKRDWEGASELLTHFSQDEALERRLDLSLAQKDRKKSVQIIGQISQSKTLSAPELDKYSFHLVNFGEGHAASKLLLKYWPFAQAGGLQKSLSDRLYALLLAHPEWLSATDKTRLAQPLPTAELRMQQARLFQGRENCESVLKVLSDFAPGYDAQSWSHIAECYQQTAPGLALYAAQRAVERDSAPYYSRQVAYLTFATQEDDSTAADPQQDEAEKGFALLRKNDIAGARNAFERHALRGRIHRNFCASSSM